MATDLFLSPSSNDLYLDPITKEIRLTESLQELVRQRLLIRLRMFRGEWFADITLGLPYFQSVFGKGTKEISDLAIRQIINETEGVVRILSYSSTVSKERELIVSFSCEVESGEIVTIEEAL